MNKAYVEKLLKLTQLPEAVQSLIDEKKITLTNAITLNTLPEDIINEYVESAMTSSGEEFTAMVGERLNEEKKLRSAGKGEVVFEAKPKLKSKDDLLVVLEQVQNNYEKDPSEYNKGACDIILAIFELDEKTVADKKAEWDQKQEEKKQKAENRKADREAKKEADAKALLESKGFKVQ